MHVARYNVAENTVTLDGIKLDDYQLVEQKADDPSKPPRYVLTVPKETDSVSEWPLCVLVEGGGRERRAEGTLVVKPRTMTVDETAPANKRKMKQPKK